MLRPQIALCSSLQRRWDLVPHERRPENADRAAAVPALIRPADQEAIACMIWAPVVTVPAVLSI